jgi:bacteriocin-like protein
MRVLNNAELQQVSGGKLGHQVVGGVSGALIGIGLGAGGGPLGAVAGGIVGAVGGPVISHTLENAMNAPRTTAWRHH